MNRTELANVGVKFIADPHGYERVSDGAKLQGVTQMIEHLLFPGEFAGVSKDVLAAKAQWGTDQHAAIQDMILFGDQPKTASQIAFSEMMAEAGLKPIATEYTVTDGKDFASNIDVLCEDGSIVDIKTSYTLNKAKVAWQLSLYAWFFELSNPGLKAGRLYAAWIPKQTRPRLVEVPRKSEKELAGLCKAWIDHTPYQAPPTKLDLSLLGRAAELKMVIAEAEAELSDLNARIITTMKDAGETSYKDQFATFSFKGASQRATTKFDLDAFKAAHKEIAESEYGRYTTVTTSAVKESLTIKLK